MKAFELQIGDWVSLLGTQRYCRVVGITEDDVRIESDDALMIRSLNDIEPIELTDEIMKLNEFISVGGTCVYYGVDDHSGIRFEIVLGDGDLYAIGEEEERLAFLTDIIYVHEMQHLANTLGLTEFNRNFKVEK